MRLMARQARDQYLWNLLPAEADQDFVMEVSPLHELG